MTNMTLVGRAMGRNFSLKTVVLWAKENWREALGYVSEVVTLTRGWFAFNFLQADHAQWVLNQN